MRSSLTFQSVQGVASSHWSAPIAATRRRVSFWAIARSVISGSLLEWSGRSSSKHGFGESFDGSVLAPGVGGAQSDDGGDEQEDRGGQETPVEAAGEGGGPGGVR